MSSLEHDAITRLTLALIPGAREAWRVRKPDPNRFGGFFFWNAGRWANQPEDMTREEAEAIAKGEGGEVFRVAV